MIFHLANAAMLPLVGQKLALQDNKEGTALMSACIVAAQVVMVPMAALVGRKADSWGRKPLFLAAFAILPLRGFLYTLSDDRYWLVAVQLLDGVGAGLYGALFVIVVADLTRGSGHFNLAQGGQHRSWARRGAERGSCWIHRCSRGLFGRLCHPRRDRRRWVFIIPLRHAGNARIGAEQTASAPGAGAR